MPGQWPRALLRAALREVGYDATGTRDLNMAEYQAGADPARGPVRLVLVDQEALADDPGPDLMRLRDRAGDPHLVLLAPAARQVHEGPWSRVVRRPVTIAHLVELVESLVPLAPEARRPLD